MLNFKEKLEIQREGAVTFLDDFSEAVAAVKKYQQEFDLRQSQALKVEGEIELGQEVIVFKAGRLFTDGYVKTTDSGWVIRDASYAICVDSESGLLSTRLLSEEKRRQYDNLYHSRDVNTLVGELPKGYRLRSEES